MADNSVTFVGNLTREPELRFAQSGIAVVNIGMAVNERRLVNGEWQDQDPIFINITAFRELAENVAASLHKGDRVVVTGKLQIRNFERQDGTKGTAVECLADEVAVSLRRATGIVQLLYNKKRHVKVDMPRKTPCIRFGCAALRPCAEGIIPHFYFSPDFLISLSIHAS